MIVFDPGARRFWVATGETPVRAQPFVGFALDDLLKRASVAALPEPQRPGAG